MTYVLYYFEGMNASELPASLNPYRKGTRPFQLWVKGWRAERYAAKKAKAKRRVR